MKGFTSNQLFTVTMGLVVLVFCALTLTLGSHAGWVPGWVLLCIFPFMVIQMVRDLGARKGRGGKGSEDADLFKVANLRKKTSHRLEAASAKATLGMVGWLGLLVGMVAWLGVTAAVGWYSLLFLRIRSHERWTLSIGLSLFLGLLAHGAMIIMAPR